jgi:hypothetical protein
MMKRIARGYTWRNIDSAIEIKLLLEMRCRHKLLLST